MSDYKRKRDKYIDLKINGRLFPSWVLANFKHFKLPDMVKVSNEDPCFRKSKLELRKYQVFLSRYLDFNSSYKNILIYHGLGSGKTTSAINIYNMLYNYTPGWNVFILIKATLKNHPWMSDLNVWLKEEERKFRFENIIFVSYDSPIADKSFMDAVKNADSSKKSMYIIDEVHNFIRNVYSNISTRQGRRAVSIYDYIIQDQKENDGTRVVLLSGTPAINSPYELALLFNLLRPNIFPKSESIFNQEFISTSSFKTLNYSKKNLFQRRIIGLVSYYIGATLDYYASKTINYVDVEMSKYQEDIYTYFEDIEEQIARKNDPIHLVPKHINLTRDKHVILHFP
jgi:SNF2 family N-terminal domain.